MGGGVARKTQSPIKSYKLQTQMVSANKFDQNLREIDGSVAVVSGEKLQELQIYNTKDLAKVIPGFILKTQTGPNSTVPSIRGISTADVYNPSIVLYVDGIPQSFSLLTQELLDVKRVELLRGPQGTIWGQNAQAGVLNIISNPITSNTPRLNANASVGSLSSNITLSGATPIIADYLYFGASIARDVYHGQIKSSRTGEKLDTSNSLSGTASLAYAPKNSGFEALFKFSGSQLVDHHTGFNVEKDVYDSLKIDPEKIKRIAFDNNGMPTTPPPDENFFPTNILDSQTYALKLSYDFGHSTLSNVTSFQKVYVKNFLPYLPLNGPGNQTKTTTNELRLNTQFDNGGYLVLGAYFQNLNNLNNLGSITINKNNASVFGEGKLPFGNWEFTLGARYSYDFSKFKKESANKHTITPKVALAYNIGETAHIYALYQLGYKPGGFDFYSGNKLKPENSQNAEIGLHSDFLGGKISFDGDFYYIYTTDKQVYSGSGFDAKLRNVGTTDSIGIEAQLSLIPIERLKILFGGAIGHSRFIKGTAASKKTYMNVDTKNNTLSFAPDVSLNANIDYLFAKIAGVNLFGNLNANFYSTTYFDETNETKQAPYATFDLSFRAEFRNGIILNAYAQNLLNQKYANYAFRDLGPTNYLIGDLLNIGLSLSYRL
ncbi:hypothetical protein BJI48_03440 [Helicobacter sp. 11S02596-1]|nr:hypothetical protein BJI48_03440 [Helicobacter sp. 11S02596-1]